MPKRLSIWTLDGKLVRALYGSPRYGGAGTLDAWDRTRLFFGYPGCMEFRLDWDKGEGQLHSICCGDNGNRFTVRNKSGGALMPERPFHVDGRVYLTNEGEGGPERTAGIWLLRDNKAVLVAAAGDLEISGNKDFADFFAANLEALNRRMPKGVAMSVHDAQKASDEKGKIVFARQDGAERQEQGRPGIAGLVRPQRRRDASSRGVHVLRPRRRAGGNLPHGGRKAGRLHRVRRAAGAFRLHCRGCADLRCRQSRAADQGVSVRLVTADPPGPAGTGRLLGGHRRPHGRLQGRPAIVVLSQPVAQRLLQRQEPASAVPGAVAQHLAAAGTCRRLPQRQCGDLGRQRRLRAALPPLHRRPVRGDPLQRLPHGGSLLAHAGPPRYALERRDAASGMLWSHDLADRRRQGLPPGGQE